MLGTGASGPLSSDLLVATAAVRQEFGARLASVYAPDVLASFGTGSAQVAIRVVAPDGAAAYTASLRADQAARVSAGKQLLRNPRIHVSAPALPALADGQVDARLLTVFAALATLHSVRVLGFAAAPAGASPGLPLRTAVPRARRAGHPAAAEQRAVAGQLPARAAAAVPAGHHHPVPAARRRCRAARRVRRTKPARAARKELTRNAQLTNSHWSSGPELGRA